MRFHDGSTRVRVYNEAGDVVQFTDENGSVMENTFDALGRKTVCDITKAADVVGTDAQAFEYDGLTRQTQSIDTVASTEATVQMFYDSMNRVVEDSQSYTGGTRNVTTTAFASHPISQLQFPNGRKIDNTYDLLYRRTDVADNGGSTIASWQFFGPSRVAELTMGNGLICTQMNNARTRSSIQEGQTELGWQGQVTPVWGDQSSDRLGYDGASRTITKRYLAGGINPITFGYLNTSSVVGFTTSFDRSSNKFFERHLHAESRSHLYEPFNNGTPQGGYDSLDRLRQYQRGVLSTNSGHNNLGGGGIDTPISLPNTDQSRTYDLDGLGNWRRTVFQPVNGSETAEVRQHNALNQITRRDSTPFSYDLNGNLLDDGIRLYTWDALNRLANVRRKSDGSSIGDYTYDATARRIRKVVSNGGLSGTIPNGTTHYLYTAWQCVEECDGFGSPLKQYVWGIYIDELLQQRLLATINNHGAGDYYPLSDLLYRTTALTDSAANIIETYDTDAYGNTLIFTAPGTANNWWANDAVESDYPTCQILFAGSRYDPEIRSYFSRFRYYLPKWGRFLSRDPIMYTEGLNLFEYVASNGPRFLDPFGLEWHHWFPQSIKSAIKALCGHHIKIDDYTTWVGGSTQQPGTQHHWIHHTFKYNDKVWNIIDQTKGDCCAFIFKMIELIFEAWRLVPRSGKNILSLRTRPYGGGDFTTIDMTEHLPRRICNDPCYSPKKAPKPNPHPPLPWYYWIGGPLINHPVEHDFYWDTGQLVTAGVMIAPAAIYFGAPVIAGGLGTGSAGTGAGVSSVTLAGSTGSGVGVSTLTPYATAAGVTAAVVGVQGENPSAQ
jgi:RHS repeat-associated protein